MVRRGRRQERRDSWRKRGNTGCLNEVGGGDRDGPSLVLAEGVQ